MTNTRAELDALLDAVHQKLPDTIQKYGSDDGGFWSDCAGQTDYLLNNAKPDDYEHERGRIDAMLAEFCLLPDDG